MNTIAVAFAGRSSSGKTSVSKRVAEEFGYKYASFGDLIRQESRSRGLPQTRDSLQAIGHELATASPAQLCIAVLDCARFTPGSSVVVDGLRHMDVWKALKLAVRPAELMLIFLDSQVSERSSRSGINHEYLNRLDEHAVEAEVQELRSEADLVVPSGLLLEDVYRIVRDRIEQKLTSMNRERNG